MLARYPATVNGGARIARSTRIGPAAATPPAARELTRQGRAGPTVTSVSSVISSMA